MPLMSMRLPEELAIQLGSLAEATGRTKSFLMVQAIQIFVEQESWQITEIKKGLAEANSGDFATSEEYPTIENQWTSHAG